MYSTLRPLLFSLEAEAAHALTLYALGVAQRSNLMRLVAHPPPADLPIRVFGIDFPNPVGLAAGLDKNGEHLDALGAPCCESMCGVIPGAIRMNTNYPRTSSLAVISLILGTFGIFGVFGALGILRFFIGGLVLKSLVPIISAPAAIICGHMARWKIRRATPGRIKGDGMALIGLSMGWVAIPIVGLITLFLFFGHMD